MLPTQHSHGHSAPAELDVRVLLANAARSAPSSPKAEKTAAAPKQASPFAEDGDGTPEREQERLSIIEAQRSTQEDEASEAAAVENLTQLLSIVSSELSADRAAASPKCLEAAAMSAADRETMGALARSIGSGLNLQGQGQGPERAHCAPLTAQPLTSRASGGGRLSSLPSEEDMESVVSAPGTMEGLHAARSGDETSSPEPARPSTSSRVSRYVSLIESRNLMISMPAWERPMLRHNSTDLVLRFLNRHRRPRHARSASPEQPGAELARSDSGESSDSEDEAEADPLADAPLAKEGQGAISDSLAVSTPPRMLSPPRSRRESPPKGVERVLSGPLRPSPLGDTSRAALADSAVYSLHGAKVYSTLFIPRHWLSLRLELTLQNA